MTFNKGISIMTNGRCDHCGEMPGVDFLQAWMRAPNPVLGDITPLEMMKAGKGDKLARFIETARNLNRSPLEPGGSCGSILCLWCRDGVPHPDSGAERTSGDPA